MPLSSTDRLAAVQLTGIAADATDDQLQTAMLAELRTNAEEMPLIVEQRKALDARVISLGRDLDGLRKIQPQPINPEALIERRLRVLGSVDGLHQVGYPKAFTDPLKLIVCGPPEAPNTMYLGRDDGREDCRAMDLINLLKNHRPGPPTGQFAAGREVPNPAIGHDVDLAKEGKEEGERWTKAQQAARGLK